MLDPVSTFAGNLGTGTEMWLQTVEMISPVAFSLLALDGH
jgi:hypothetical protein